MTLKRHALATCFAGILFGTAHAAIIEGPAVGPAIEENAISQFDIIVDGAFSNNVEWSDITPVGHISTPDSSEFSTPVTDPNDANVLTYAALSRGIGVEGPSGPPGLYLMYDVHEQDDLATLLERVEGKLLGNIFFQVELPADLRQIDTNFPPIDAVFETDTETHMINVVLEVAGSDELGTHDLFGVEDGGEGLYNVFIDVDMDDSCIPGVNTATCFETRLTPEDLQLAGINVEAAAGFGFSPFKDDVEHLLIELEIGLGFNDEFFQPGVFDDEVVVSSECGGVTCGYSPDPSFWGSNFSSTNINILGISPNGSTFIANDPAALLTASEPGTLLMLLAGVAGLRFARVRR